MNGFQQEILSATNAFRAKQGKGPLKLSSKVRILSKHFNIQVLFPQLIYDAQRWSDYLGKSCLGTDSPPSQLAQFGKASNLASFCGGFPSGKEAVIKNWAYRSKQKGNVSNEGLYQLQ